MLLRSSKMFLAYSLAFLLLTLAGYSLVLWQIWNTRQQLITVHQQDLLAAAQAEAAFLMARSLKEHQAKLERLDTYVLKGSDVPRFIEKLEALSEELGVSLHLASLSTDREALPQLALDLSLKGGFAEIMRFVRAVELLPLRLEISRLALASKPVETPLANSVNVPGKRSFREMNPEWTATMKLDVLSFDPKKSPRKSQ